MKISAILVALAAAFAATAAAAEEWYPSKYGADDTIGALNNLSPEKTRSAAGLVTQGKVYALGVVTGPKTPAYPGRDFKMIVYPHGDGSGATSGASKPVGNDDYLATWLGIGTQIDGFAHLGIDHRYYNGTPIGEIMDRGGVKKFGTHLIPPIATRGVLLDMTKVFEATRLKAGTAFNRPEIEAAAKAQGLEIGAGDVVLFHTGWLGLADEDAQAFVVAEPGLGVGGAEYLASLGVAAVGADTAALEAIPFESADMPFAVHQTLLAKNGVHILENIDTRALIADGVSEFLFVVGVPRFEGAVQMVINPVAIR